MDIYNEKYKKILKKSDGWLSSQAYEIVFDNISKYLIVDKAVESSVLDLGCGAGKILRVIEKYGYDCYGIDISEFAIKHGKCISGNLCSKIDLQCGDVTDLPWKGHHFDLILDVMTLHCLKPTKRNAYFNGIKRVIKDGGLYILFSKYNEPKNELGYDKRTRIKLDKTGCVRYFADIDEIKEEVSRYGFNIIDIKYIVIDYKNILFLVCKKMSGC